MESVSCNPPLYGQVLARGFLPRVLTESTSLRGRLAKGGSCWSTESCKPGGNEARRGRVDCGEGVEGGSGLGGRR